MKKFDKQDCIVETYKQPRAFAMKHKDLTTRMSSRSGGIFTALSDWLLEMGGVVYGCALDQNYVAFHLRATTKSERNRLRGSKYVQSELGNVFKQVKEDLQSGLYVLFSGTSCQVAALKSYVKQCDCSKLLLVDILCHGVPSPKVWKDYLAWLEKKHDGKVTEVEFRNKRKYGWKDHIESISINGVVHDSKVYTELFYKHSIIRPCCYSCPYKSLVRESDVTIADFWGIDKAVSNFNDNKGVSLILINNSVGMNYLKSVEEDVNIVECKTSDCMQPPLERPFEKPLNREEFWRDYSRKSFGYVVFKYEKFLPYKICLKVRKFIHNKVKIRR